MSHCYLLDTDTIIYLLRGSETVADRVRAAGDRRLAMPAIALAELCYGAYHSRHLAENLKTIDRFRRRVRLIPFDRRAAVIFGSIKAGLGGAHAPGDSDLFIAATALAADAVLVTNNLRHFAAIDGLAVESWVTPAPAGAPSAPRRRKPRA